MPKRTVRASIPVDSPDKFMELIKEIWEMHQKLGASSPLLNNSIIDMSKFEEKMNNASQYRKEALAHYAQAQAAMGLWRVEMGIAKGQTINTEGTLYFMTDVIKRYLLLKSPRNEEYLTTWGFNVVVGTADVGRKRKKKKKP